MEESLLDRAAEEEGDQILQELPRLWKKMTALRGYLDTHEHMEPKAKAAGFGALQNSAPAASQTQFFLWNFVFFAVP